MNFKSCIRLVFTSGLVPLFILGCSEDKSVLSEPAASTEAQVVSITQLDEQDPITHNLSLINERLNDDNTADDSYWMMVRDMGGTLPFLKFKEEASKEEVADKYMQYGMEYEYADNSDRTEKAPEAPDHVKLDCPDYFRSSVSNKTWELKDWWFGDHTASIDLTGRPFLGIVEINFGQTPPQTSRDGQCAYKVGRMGGRTSDDAGHLIAKGLGGWNKRANLVPQNSNVNRGTINNVIEKAVRDCSRKTNSLIKYGVTANYKDGWALRPTDFDVEIWVSTFTGFGLGGAYDAWPRYKHARIRNESANSTDRLQASNFASFVKEWC